MIIFSKRIIALTYTNYKLKSVTYLFTENINRIILIIDVDMVFNTILPEGSACTIGKAIDDMTTI